jgi:hypothetical protein
MQDEKKERKRETGGRKERKIEGKKKSGSDGES